MSYIIVMAITDNIDHLRKYLPSDSLSKIPLFF